MKRFVPAVAFGIVTIILSSVSVAGTLDHLLCYRAQDPLQIQAAVDMLADLQPEFAQKGCQLIRPFEFCVPATKTNVQPPPTGPGVVGQSLRDDYICYVAKCPDAVQPGDKTVSDQFGTRVQHNYRPYKVCVPARKAPTGCSRRGKACGGVCPNPADDCRLDRATKTCTCAPQQCSGHADAFGTCGGQCTLATDRCLPDAAGKCVCQPPTTPPCGPNTTAGACGGTCPDPADKCLPGATPSQCICRPQQQPCAAVSGGPPDVCGGDCPNPSEQCGFDISANKCVCQSPPCAPNTLTGQCGGSCPVGTTCRFVGGSAPLCACQ